MILINSLVFTHGSFCISKFSSQLQHLHPNNRGFYSNKELMPLPVGFSTQLLCTCESKQMLQKPWLCPSLRSLLRVQTSAMSTAVFHGDTRLGLHFPAQGNRWFHISWQDWGFGLVEEQRATPQANASLKPSSTNICSSEAAPGVSRHTTTVNI